MRSDACSDTLLSLFVWMQHRGHLGTHPKCKGQNRQQGLRFGCMQHCPGSYTALGTLFKVGRLSSCTAKAGQRIRWRERKDLKGKRTQDPVDSDINSIMLSLKSFLCYSEEAFRNSVTRSRTSWVT